MEKVYFIRLSVISFYVFIAISPYFSGLINGVSIGDLFQQETLRYLVF